MSIIITNYNGEAYLEKCLASIYQQTFADLEIILVDNNSSDGSIRLVRQKFPQVEIIENKENYGFAGGNNIGFRHSKGDFILILNNDTVLEKDTIENLVESFDKIDNLGVVQPKILLMGGENKLDECGAFLTSTGFLYHYGIYRNADLEKYNRKFPVYSVKGACMLIRREVIEEVGLFDDDFFCFFEETDFCHRVWLAGYECWYYPKSVMHHALGGTTLRQRASLIQYHSFKNRICSLIKNLSFLELFKILPVHLIFCQLAALGLLVTGEFFSAWAVQRAIGWNFLHLRETLEKRREIQSKIRKISERELMARVKRSVRPSYYYHLLTKPENYED